MCSPCQLFPTEKSFDGRNLRNRENQLSSKKMSTEEECLHEDKSYQDKGGGNEKVSVQLGNSAESRKC